MNYGTIDRCTGGVASADSETNGAAASAFDNNDATFWAGSDGLPHYIIYDFGAGVSYAISKLTALLFATSGCMWKDFTVSGKIDGGSIFDTLYTGVAADIATLQTFTWVNKTRYRYIKTNITTDYRASAHYATAYELAMFEGLYPGGFGFGSPMIFLKDMWDKHNKLWAPKGLILPKDLSLQY